MGLYQSLHDCVMSALWSNIKYYCCKPDLLIGTSFTRLYTIPLQTQLLKFPYKKRGKKIRIQSAVFPAPDYAESCTLLNKTAPNHTTCLKRKGKHREKEKILIMFTEENLWREWNQENNGIVFNFINKTFALVPINSKSRGEKEDPKPTKGSLLDEGFVHTLRGSHTKKTLAKLQLVIFTSIGTTSANKDHSYEGDLNSWGCHQMWMLNSQTPGRNGKRISLNVDLNTNHKILFPLQGLSLRVSPSDNKSKMSDFVLQLN